MGPMEPKQLPRTPAEHQDTRQRVRGIVGAPAVRYAGGVLGAIAAQAAEADRTRTVAAPALAGIRSSELLSLSACRELGGREESVGAIAAELEAVAAACASTAWCLWNHLCVFHLYCGALGPGHAELLGSIVANREWVCFPGGAGSRLLGRLDGDAVVLDGPTQFGSGCRYADWAGAAFAVLDPATGRPSSPPDLRFTIVRLDGAGVSIEPTWDGASLRASSTDTVSYRDVAVPVARCEPWFAANRAEALRDPALGVINHRYREDWVGLSDLWLGAMAIGVCAAALDDTVEEVGGRRAIMGRPMHAIAGVQFHLGRAALALAAARACVVQGCADVDARIASATTPDDAAELRQYALSVAALAHCETAMDHLQKTLGGNGLREGHPFERRYRDFQAMPVHINAHEDRVTERLGRHLLAVAPEKF